MELPETTDAVLKIYSDLKGERDSAIGQRDEYRKALEETRSYLIKAMKIAKDMNEGMWSHNVDWKDRQFVETLSGRFRRLERRLIREDRITEDRNGYK